MSRDDVDSTVAGPLNQDFVVDLAAGAQACLEDGEARPASLRRQECLASAPRANQLRSTGIRSSPCSDSDETIAFFGVEDKIVIRVPEPVV